MAGNLPGGNTGRTMGPFSNPINRQGKSMTQAEMTKIAMAVGALFVVYKFVPHPAAKTAAVAVAGVIVAKRVPILADVL
jgi:hypothetical protein